MSVLDFLDTGEYRILPSDYDTHPALDDRETTTRRLNPAFRRPAATGDQPIYTPSTIGIVDGPTVDPAETARISIPVTYGSPAAPAEPARPRWYRGTRRLSRSRAALLAARGGIGGRPC